MEQLEANYRPKSIDFDVVSTGLIPENLGQFDSLDEATKFINDNFISINQRIKAVRYIDAYEKKVLRKDYQELLEMKMPLLERDLKIATSNYNEAKKNLADAKEMLNATLTEVKAIAVEVKNGVRDIELDDTATFRITAQDKFFFFTYIDKELKLAKIQEVMEHEKSELFNSMEKNENYFNVEIAEEKRQKE